MKAKRSVANRNVPFFKPSIGKDEEQAVLDVLRSGWLTTGMRVCEFEKDFASYTKSGYAVALSSCTAALHLALEVLGLNEDDEVITTPFTFSSTASEILHTGAKIKFADVDCSTGNIDPAKIRDAITDRTKVILPVHFAGHPCDMDSIMELALEYNLRVIEDAAHALEAEYGDYKVGSIGDFTCFSFYATKNVTTGEGGMITCDNEIMAEKMRLLSLHGMTKDAWKRYMPDSQKSAENKYYQIVSRGYKYNMTDIQAALGITQLRKVEKMWERRNNLVSLYRTCLADIPEIELMGIENDIKHANHLMLIRVVPDELDISRDEFVTELRERGIGTSIHFVSLHMHPYYKDIFGFEDNDFPNAAYLSNNIITLPLYPDLPEDDVLYVTDCIKEIVEKYKSKKLISVTS